MDRDKAIGIFKLKLNGIFTPFTQYGLSVFIPDAIDEIVKLSLELHKQLALVEEP